MASKVAANGDVKERLRSLRGEEPQGEAVNNLTAMYLLVAGSIAAAWALGYFAFSSLWIFLIVSCLFIVWKAKIHKIIKRQLALEQSLLHRKKALRQNETVEWLNFLLNRWWVFSSRSVEELVKKRMDERLLDIKPSFIEKLEMTTFTLGDQTPHIKDVRIFECSEGIPGGHKPIKWFNVNKPPSGLDKMSSYQIIMESDVTLLCEDFKMIFRARIGNKKVSLGVDFSVEDLFIEGTMQAILHLTMDVPFPHISKVAVCFTEKPDVTFNVNVSRAIQMMEIPLLKSWVHTNVMEGLTKAMVDPASVDLTIGKTGPVSITEKKPKHKKAQGVLTVHLKGSPPKSAAADEVRYTVLRVGDMKRQAHEVPADEEWEDMCSLFIYKLANDKLVVKTKCKRLLISTVLEQHDITLGSIPFQIKPYADVPIESKDGSKISLTLQYTPLPPIDLEAMQNNPPAKPKEMAGVLYVCIHGAVGVMAADRTGTSDPYCVLFCDRRRLLTTPYVPRTCSPKWEASTEFFVADFSKTNLSFFVFDWDGTSTIDDDFLGSAHMSLSQSDYCSVKTTLTLGYNKPKEGYVTDKNCGEITVSVVFRSVSSVAKSEKFRAMYPSVAGNDHLYRQDYVSPATKADAHPSSSHVRSVADKGPKKSSVSAYLEGYLEGKTIVELTILQGKDMMAMDRNGYSDPFCVVLLNGKKIFTSSVKKKTLFPKWNETVTIEMPNDTSTVEIDVFDKDFISKDFMGKLTLDLDKLKELAIKGTSEWFSLDRTKTGKLQLKCTVISKDMMAEDEGDGGSYGPTSIDSQEVPVFAKENEALQMARTVPQVMVDDSLSAPSIYDSSFDMSPSPTARAPSPYPESTPSRDGRATSAGSETVVMRRTTSDHNVNKGRRGSGYPNPSATLGRNDSFHRQGNSSLRPSESVNSVHIVQRTGDTASIDSSMMGDKLYSVSGQVLRARGLENIMEDVYCKVRLELPASRRSLFSGSRVIAKSRVTPSATPTFNLPFEVDRGAGISPDAMLVFDIKRSSKEHIATKGYLLRELFAETDGVCRWIRLERDVELEITLSQGSPNPRHHRRSGNLFKSLSFRKDKRQ